MVFADGKVLVFVPRMRWHVDTDRNSRQTVMLALAPSRAEGRRGRESKGWWVMADKIKVLLRLVGTIALMFVLVMAGSWVSIARGSEWTWRVIVMLLLGSIYREVYEIRRKGGAP